MKILFLTWKDRKHPWAGGAEVVNEEIARRLAQEGHEVLLLVGGFRGAKKEESINGYRVIRLGNRYSVYWQAYRYYCRHLQGWADLVVDEVNTLPFFAKFYAKEPTVLFVHQLCRKIWMYQMPPPLSFIGYLCEPVYLRLVKNCPVITISESTRRDLARHGHCPDHIQIISEGIECQPLADVAQVKKFEQPTLLSLGGIRPMKRTHHQIKAFELAKRHIPNLKLKVAGGAAGRYGRKVLQCIRQSPHAPEIEYLGKVSEADKLALMRQSHLLLATSVKEGWGLTVTEAASQGSPAVVYDVDGLRDSVRHNQTGITTAPHPGALANGIVTALGQPDHYQRLQRAAWEWSKQITFDQSYNDFKRAVGLNI